MKCVCAALAAAGFLLFANPGIASSVAPPRAAAQSAASAFAQEAKMSAKQLLDRWQPIVAEAARRFAVPQSWIRAVMRAESGGRTMLDAATPIVSDMGAEGLMQLMPATFKEMSAQYGLGANPFDPRANILAGAAYLHWLHGKYGYPQMFAAYNDGPGNLEQRLKDGRMLPAETQRYVSAITGKSARFAARAHGELKFTRPNGTPVSIDCAAIASVRAALPQEYAPGVQTVIAVGRVHQGVLESLAAVKAAIRSHGGQA